MSFFIPQENSASAPHAVTRIIHEKDRVRFFLINFELFSRLLEDRTIRTLMSSAAALFHSGDPKTIVDWEVGSSGGFLPHPASNASDSESITPYQAVQLFIRLLYRPKGIITLSTPPRDRKPIGLRAGARKER